MFVVTIPYSSDLTTTLNFVESKLDMVTYSFL